MSRAFRRTLGAGAWVGIVWATPLVAQRSGPVVGVVLGAVRNEQVWQPEGQTERVLGATLGAFADVPLPVTGLGIVAEAAYTQRHGDVAVEVGGQSGTGGVRSAYLAVAVQLQLSGSIGPMRLHALAGPTIDQLLTSRLDPVLGQVLDHESPVAFGVAAGGGLGGWLGDRLFIGAEIRLSEGLADAYSGSFTRFHNRSVEGRLRVGVPLSWLRDR